MKRIGVCLGGCGVFDGSEIHESVAVIVALARVGADPVFMAPDVPQMHVVNHSTGEVAVGETRNVLEESARIARGKIMRLEEVSAADFDGLIFPGGFGAAKNLSNFATQGVDCSVDPEVRRIVLETQAAGKPLGFICIAPAMGAAILGKVGEVSLTIGSDASTASALEAMGATHRETSVDEICVDEKAKVVSTSAYMLAENAAQVADGIDKLVQKVVELTS
jgi:enhancing lycopene biosynthesis protein 2